ncbi:hypothetical protein GBF38_008642 [Nibea albiflora]|uniref:Uncharacterized protein n=1 Tax=Nibea albiflora TaxID=240163 RepID=A0ACB7EQF5_NIBAL|nr:hypothetical protein GBF38_008642 [Nibea albiflora]
MPLCQNHKRVQSKNLTDPANSNGAPDASMWTRQTQGSQTGRVQDSTNPGPSVDGRVWERLRSKNAGNPSPAKPSATLDVSTVERHGVKREANCENQDRAGKTVKMDADLQRNLGNVRVHIRDLGVKIGGGAINRDMKKEPVKGAGTTAGKGARVKTRS